MASTPTPTLTHPLLTALGASKPAFGAWLTLPGFLAARTAAGASPHLSSPSSPTSPVSATFPRTSALHRVSSVVKRAAAEKGPQATSEAFDDVQTPPLTPVLRAQPLDELHLTKGKVADLSFERPFYEMIVDGIHSHPNSVRVSSCDSAPAELALGTVR